MKYPTPFHEVISKSKGIFEGRNFLVSNDSISWHYVHSLRITDEGQMSSTDEEGNQYILLKSLQSCYVQIIPHLNNKQQQQPPARRILTRKTSSLSNNSDNSVSEEPPVVYIKTYDNEKLYIKIPIKTNFVNLMPCLLVWQALKPQTLAKKWYCENKVTSTNGSDVHEVLVCRFKIYGPIPSKSKNIKVVPGAKAPVYQPKGESTFDSQIDGINGNSNVNYLQGDNVNEGWFYTMGVLKSNGVLNFITELDGTLLYSIDMKQILSSEIRQIHHSIFDNSNVLFVGNIKELRSNNCIKTISYPNETNSFLFKDGKTVASNQRILIEFPLHIDLEDWFVGLNYFSMREYIGSYSPGLTPLNQPSNPVNSNIETPATVQDSVPLSDYSKENLRVSKKVFIDIIEAKLDEFPKTSSNPGKIYAEVIMWGLPWSRTALVSYSENPFWKEEFVTDLPILTQMIHILIKKSSLNESTYLSSDKLIGTVYLTPDILTKQMNTSSTMMMGSALGNSINVNGLQLTDSNTTNNDIVRLAIYDSSNLPIGKLLLNVKLKEHHILPPKVYKPLENMLLNAPMKDLIKFCNENVQTSEFENVSLIMLDIFQSLGIEDRWFKSLMEVELVSVDKMTRKNYTSNKRSRDNKAQTNNNSSSSNNVFNTLFRGLSIFSKSLEMYNLRIGQEYLEKVFGEFMSKISYEEKDCETDPRYIRLQIKAERKGKTMDDSDLESDDDSDDYDSDIEKENEELIKERVNTNFSNLYHYAEEVWNKIYITSNDLPQQIKYQLKNFRTKVELSCDPDDKVTALNCLSSFIFLRFFCPAILNPKLFYLTKDHQTGKTQRTLTLIAKILLNLANRQEFSAHKEPHLVRMNTFLESHKDDLLEYFDKITGRKNDFNEKILDLSHEVKRFDLGISGDKSSLELPTTPYLIDKYLRLTELIYLLDFSKAKSMSHLNTPSSQNGLVNSGSSVSIESSISYNGQSGNGNQNNNGSFDEIHLNNERNVYQIGSLEFEKSEFLDLAGDNDTEGFIKSLCRSNENIFSFITSDITLKDLQKQSQNLTNLITDLEAFLERYEYPSNYLSKTALWDAFTADILSRVYLDTTRNCIIHLDRLDTLVPSNLKKLTENAFSALKLKFPETRFESESSSGAGMTQSLSTNSLGSIMKSSSKNPFKKWLRKA